MNTSLPELVSPHSHGMPPGPTPWSNWVIPGRVLAGAYPASLDDVETEQLLTLLLELGVTTFVCLQAEVNIHIPEHSWRAGMGLRPYIRDAQRLLSRAQDTSSTRITQRKIDFLHLPIIDGSVTTDSAMSRLADDCCDRVLRGETMYIHCWGGHGRTGTLVAVMLGRLYDLPASGALRLTQAYHDSRVYPQGVRSPQTTVQRAQVKRLLLLPNAFAGIAKAAATRNNSSSRPNQQQQQQQQQHGSPQGASRPVMFSPATPAKQPVVPSGLIRPSGRTTPAAAGRVTGAPSATPAGAAAAAAGMSFAAGSSPSAARNLSLARSATANPSSSSSSSSSSYQPRLLLQHPAPSTAAAGVIRSGSLNSSSSSIRGSSGGGSSRHQWVGGAAGLSPSALASSSRVQAATSTLLRSDVLRTPMQSRVVQPVSYSPIRRTVAVDGTA